MNLGKLDRQIDLQQYSEVRTDSGSFDKVWTKLTTIWAVVNWKSGGEKNEADQDQGYNTVEFTIRFCSSISANEKQRILYNNEYFDIEYVNEIERKKYYKLVTRRKTVWQEK
jgi:SPP1 family predicted phage head-tail adaptor